MDHENCSPDGTKKVQKKAKSYIEEDDEDEADKAVERDDTEPGNS